MAFIQASDMSYLGKFDLPHYAGPSVDNPYLVDFGGFGPGLGPDGSLFLGGWDGAGAIARFTIPALDGTAPVVTNAVVVPGTFDGSSNGTFVGGTLYWNNRLIVTKAAWYADASSFVASHTSAAIDLTGWTTPQPNDAPIARSAAMALGIIPTEWRAAFGKPCFIAGGPMSIAGNASPGPCLYGFDPDDVDGSGTIDVIPYLYHTVDDRLLWNPSNMIGGAAWIGDSVIFLGTNGGGESVYQQPPNVTDPCNPDESGFHAYPYDLHAWAYDANDLLEVRQGLIDPWAPNWYAHWTLPTYNSSPCALIRHRGGVYDPATGKYYLCQSFGSTPRVQVYQFDTDAPPEGSEGGAVVPTVVSFL